MKNRIKELRKGKKITQTALADYLGIAQNTLSYWENGIYDIDNLSLQRVADYFQCSTDYILLRDDEYQLPITNLLEQEKRLVSSYRNQPELQIAVDRLLGIETPPLQYTKAKMIAGDDVDAETVTQGSYDERAALAEELNREE